MKQYLNFFRRTLRPYLIDPEKQDQTAVATSLIFSLLLVVFGFRGLIPGILNSIYEVGHGQTIENQINDKVENLNLAVSGLGSLRDDIGLIDASLPETKDLPNLLESLNLIFGGSNVLLEGVRFSAPKPSAKPNILILPFEIKASGNYESILAAIKAIEKNPRPLELTQVVFELPPKGDKRFLTVTVELQTYFLKKLYI